MAGEDQTMADVPDSEALRTSVDGPIGSLDALDSETSISIGGLSIEGPRIEGPIGKERSDLIQSAYETIKAEIELRDIWKGPAVYLLLGGTNAGKSNFARRLLNHFPGILLCPRVAIAEEAHYELASKGRVILGRYRTSKRVAKVTGSPRLRNAEADSFICVYQCAPHRDEELKGRLLVVDETEELSKPHGKAALACALRALDLETKCRGIVFCGPEDGSILKELVRLGFATKTSPLTQVRFGRMSKLEIMKTGVESHQLLCGDAIFVPSMLKLDEIARRLSYERADLTVGYVYGTQDEEEREMTLGRFLAKELSILLVTSCVSHGVNLMVLRMLFYFGEEKRGKKGKGKGKGKKGKKEERKRKGERKEKGEGEEEDESEEEDGLRGREELSAREVRQIAGRAGRQSTAGMVGCYLTAGSKTWVESEAFLRKSLMETPEDLKFSESRGVDLERTQAREFGLEVERYSEQERLRKEGRLRREGPRPEEGLSPEGESKELTAARLGLEFSDSRAKDEGEVTRPGEEPRGSVEYGRILRLLMEALIDHRVSVSSGDGELPRLVSFFRLIGSLEGMIQRELETKELEGAQRLISQLIWETLP